MATKRSDYRQTHNKVKSAINLSPLKHKNFKKKRHLLSDEKIASLKELFLMGGITPTQAGLFAGVNFLTVKAYFREWAEEIINEPEHLTWAEREAHARVRALESVTKQIIKVNETIAWFEKILENLLVKKNKKTKQFELKEKVMDIQNILYRIVNIEKIVRLNNIYHSELQMQYASIDMMPPVAAILEKELEKWIAAKQEQINITNDDSNYDSNSDSNSRDD